MRAGLRRLGQVVSVNHSIILLLGDADVAVGWGGAANRITDVDTGGSDWERCYQALHRDGHRPSAAVSCGGGELLAVTIDSGGWVNVVRGDAGIVLVGHAYSEVDDDDDDLAYDGLFRDAGFVDWLTSPFAGDAADAGRITVRSGTVAILPAPVPGDDIDEGGLLASVPAGDYRVRVENPVERDWGGAARAVIEPWPGSPLTGRNG